MRDREVPAAAAPRPAWMLLLSCLALLIGAASWPVGAAAQGAQELEATLLNVDVPLFDPNLPASAAVMRQQGIYPEIRRVEARYFAVALARRLAQGGEWGDVRVVPAADPANDLTVQGTLRHSDGRRLSLGITAIDARGAVWVDRTYTIETPVELSGDGALDRSRRGPDALAPLYDRIAEDLRAVRERLPPADRRRIREVGVLRYAEALAPQAFGGYLVRLPAPTGDEAMSADGSGGSGGSGGSRVGGTAAEVPSADPEPLPVPTYRALRLPATDDPMLARIRRVRLTERQLKDTAHQLYGRTFDDIRDGYETWRRYAAQQLAYIEQREQGLSGDRRRRRRDANTYAAYKQSYEDYRWAKLQEQRLAEWAERLDTEVSPTVKEVEGTLVELQGTLEEQYAQWRRILNDLFELETGGPASPSPPAAAKRSGAGGTGAAPDDDDG